MLIWSMCETDNERKVGGSLCFTEAKYLRYGKYRSCIRAVVLGALIILMV